INARVAEALGLGLNGVVPYGHRGNATVLQTGPDGKVHLNAAGLPDIDCSAFSSLARYMALNRPMTPGQAFSFLQDGTTGFDPKAHASDPITNYKYRIKTGPLPWQWSSAEQNIITGPSNMLFNTRDFERISEPEEGAIIISPAERAPSDLGPGSVGYMLLHGQAKHISGEFAGHANTIVDYRAGDYVTVAESYGGVGPRVHTYYKNSVSALDRQLFQRYTEKSAYLRLK
ncbi:MAG: hypothetical protein AB1403_24970, partial [Candidatus Riflebacteria bacterium]